MTRLVSVAKAAICMLAMVPRVHAGEESIRLASGSGDALTTSRCAICHSLDYIRMNAPAMSDPDAWAKIVRKMITAFGAPITDEEARRIGRYLDEHYKPND